jgi:hypothetical protein
VIEPNCGSESRNMSQSANPQIIAESIVFSFLQKQNYPERENFLTPCIGVGYSHLFVVLYDPEHDVLLESCKIPLVKAKDPHKFNLMAVVVSWLAVNYKFLCTGLTEEMMNFNKAEFSEQAQSKLHVYREKLYMGNVTSTRAIDVKPVQFLGRENSYLIDRRKKLKALVEQCEKNFSQTGFRQRHLYFN